MTEQVIANEQIKVTRILWGGLCFSNLTFLYLVFSGILTKGLDSGDGQIWMVTSAISIFIAVVSLVWFIRTTSIENLKNLRSSINVSNVQIHPGFMEQFNAASEKEKQDYCLCQKLLQRFVIFWALNESITIFGIVGLFMNMPESYFYIHFFIAVVLMGYMFPKSSFFKAA